MLTKRVTRTGDAAAGLPEDQGDKAPAIVVVGIGNEYRRDDAAGLLVARELRRRTSKETGGTTVRICECTGGSFELMDDWAGADIAILVDAVASGADPGTLFRLDVGGQPVPVGLFTCSTHGFDLPQTIELARLLGKLPPEVVIFGVEGAEFGHGLRISQDVAAALEQVVAHVLVFLHDHERADENKGKGASLCTRQE